MLCVGVRVYVNIRLQKQFIERNQNNKSALNTIRIINMHQTSSNSNKEQCKKDAGWKCYFGECVKRFAALPHDTTKKQKKTQTCISNKTSLFLSIINIHTSELTKITSGNFITFINQLGFPDTIYVIQTLE